jgi:hypothetical protein
MNQDIAVTVQELLDRENVTQLIHRYCFALDQGSFIVIASRWIRAALKM